MQRRHPNLRHIRQANIPSMLLKAFILPEKRLRHSGRHYQNIKQRPAYQCSHYNRTQHGSPYRLSKLGLPLALLAFYVKVYGIAVHIDSD